MDPEIKAQIDNMTQLEMARLWRFAPSGSLYLSPPYGEYFAARFKSLGFFTPEISKQIGWDG